MAAASPQTAPSQPTLSEIKRRLSSSGTSFSPTSPQNRQLKPTGTSQQDPASPEAANKSLPLAAIDETELNNGQFLFEDDSDLQDDDVDDQTGAANKLCWKESAIKTGYLMKKGERRHAWKKRYFVLRPNKFGYYKDEKEYKLLRDIPLSDIRTCAEVQVKRHDNVFGIVTNSRTYYVQATSEADVDDWVAKIITTAKASKLKIRDSDDENATPQAGDQTPVRQPSSNAQGIPIPVGIPVSITDQLSSSQVSSSTLSSSSNPLTAPSTEETASSYTSHAGPIAMPASLSLGGIIPPPNSFAQPSALQNTSRPAEMARVDRSLLNMDLNSIDKAPITRQGRSYSSASSSQSPSTGYFAASRSQSGTRPVSPGNIVSSSEEDDDFDEPPLTPVSPRGDPMLSVSPATQGMLRPLSDKIILSGYLTKQGKRKNWRKRWFALTNTRLSYSRSHMDSKILQQIPLARVLDVLEYQPPAPAVGMRGSRSAHSNMGSPSASESAPDSKLAAFQHCFQIITPKRTLRLCATDEESEIKWISAIRVLLAANRRSSVPPPAAVLPTLMQQPPTPSRQQSDPIQSLPTSSNPIPSIEGQLLGEVVRPV